MAVIEFKAVCKVYANLIIKGVRSIEDVPDKYLVGTHISMCAKKIIDHKLTYKAACGVLPDAETYKNDISTGYCKDNVDATDTLEKYLRDMKKGYLIK